MGVGVRVSKSKYSTYWSFRELPFDPSVTRVGVPEFVKDLLFKSVRRLRT